MTIELLGDNCRKCRLLKNNIELAVKTFGAGIEIRDIEDPERFAAYHLLSLPGLAIDGQVKTAGQLLSTREIIAMLGNH